MEMTSCHVAIRSTIDSAKDPNSKQAASLLTGNRNALSFRLCLFLLVAGFICKNTSASSVGLFLDRTGANMKFMRWLMVIRHATFILTCPKRRARE